jgi:hypothetical protein
MDLALTTAQRREDITRFKFSDIKDGRLFVDQEKTGYILAIPLDLELKAPGMILGILWINAERIFLLTFFSTLTCAAEAGGRVR